MVVFAAAPESVFESGRTDNALEVDPDCIKKTVQLLLQQRAQLERERVKHFSCFFFFFFLSFRNFKIYYFWHPYQDDLKIQAVNVKKQLDETYEVQNKNEAKIGSMVLCIRQLNEEKGALEVQLDQKETNLSHEVIYRKKEFVIILISVLIIFVVHIVVWAFEAKNWWESATQG